MPHSPESRRSSEILRGRQEIAQYLGVSINMVNQLISLGLIPVCRINNKPSGMVFITKRKLCEAFDEEAERQSKTGRSRRAA